jgi:hypothetical protein
MQKVINTVDTLCAAEFPTIDLSCLVVEHKKMQGSRHICQLVMAMVSSLNQFKTMGLWGFDWPVFGLLVEASTAILYVSWMNSEDEVRVKILSEQISDINKTIDHRGRYLGPSRALCSQGIRSLPPPQTF